MGGFSRKIPHEAIVEDVAMHSVAVSACVRARHKMQVCSTAAGEGLSREGGWYRSARAGNARARRRLPFVD